MMSKIVKQRVSMHDESTTLSIQSKSIKKKKNTNRKCNEIKQLICIVQVPKSLSEHIYIKSDVELKLALSYVPSNCLGNLKESPFTYNHRVTRTDHLDDVFFYTLELLDKPSMPVEQIIELINSTGDPCAQLAVELVNQRFNILNEYTKHYYISNDELKAYEEIAKDYPYQCLIQKVNKNNTSFSQRIVNEQFYTLMGVTKEMMLHHLHETKTIPTIFDLDGNLQSWCDINLASLSQVKYFDHYINTYEGAKYKCRIEQRQMYKRTHLNPNQIVFIEFWIYKLEEPTKSMLLNPQRLYKNQIDYFNKKDTALEYQLFQESMKYKETPHYKNSKPCGFKTLPWI